MGLVKIDNGLQHIEKGLMVVSWGMTIGVTLMLVSDVLLRFFFGYPLPASWEISEICMPTIVFFAFAYTLTIGGHVKVTLVWERMSPTVQKIFDIINYSISIFICVLLTYWSWKRFWGSFVTQEEILAAIYIPWWPGKLAMPIGMGFFTIRYALLLLDILVPYKKTK